MPKKKSRQQQKQKQPLRQSRSRRKAVLIAGLILCLGLTSALLAQWRSIHTSSNYLSPAPQTSPTPQLSKEYIYAGGRLIATEEPSSGGGTSTLSPPSSLIATGTSTSQVNLNWTAATGGTVDHYQIERMQSLSAGYTVIASNVTATSYNDTAVSSTSAYLYRVRAVDSQGNFTTYSNKDLATTATFTDDPLNPAGTRTIIKAQHLVELRQAVNAARALAGLSAASWTYPDPVSSPTSQRRTIYLEDVTDLRSKLDEALTILEMSQSYPTDPPLARGSAVSAAHFTQIRERLK
ncbi:MAG TPA: fibronectin type III domain-containing protein [Pyrinomonadaceae bacterium]